VRGLTRDEHLPRQAVAGQRAPPLLKGAAADISAGRLDPSDAPRFIVATVLAAYTDASPRHAARQKSPSRT
jgi:hypothetical protein